MTDRDRYIPGVPCWADADHPDPAAAVEFDSELFRRECEDTMPDGAPGAAAWNTYVWVDDADATTAAAPAAGGTILVEPFDVFDAGRMATFADPEGAAVSVWQPGRHRGALAVNEHGGVSFNDLHCRDPDRAASFYGSVFGWTPLEVGPGMTGWSMPAYGDFLEELNPGCVPGWRR